MTITRMIGLGLLVMCILGGLVSALFAPTLAATLSVPPVSQASPPPGAELTQSPVGQAPSSTPQPTQLASGVTVLAQDTFQRPDQALWGQASDGQIWSGDANISSLFSIVNNAGQISGGPGTVQAIMSVNSQDAELLVSGTVNQFNARGTTNLGGVLRWQDARNWYKMLIDGSKLQLLKSVQGNISVLATQPFNAVGGTAYSLRFRVLGSYLFVKAWPSAQAEPTNWMLQVIDTALRMGSGGLRMLLASGAVIRVNSFIETSVPRIV